jgi:hypothetical protein
VLVFGFFPLTLGFGGRIPNFRRCTPTAFVQADPESRHDSRACRACLCRRAFEEIAGYPAPRGHAGEFFQVSAEILGWTLWHRDNRRCGWSVLVHSGLCPVPSVAKLSRRPIFLTGKTISHSETFETGNGGLSSEDVEDSSTEQGMFYSSLSEPDLAGGKLRPRAEIP